MKIPNKERDVIVAKYRCKECEMPKPEDPWLVATNPFEPEDEILGCPVCKSVNSAVMLCDEPGCSEDRSCGWPTGDAADAYDGYRLTCGNHYRELCVKDLPV